MSIAPPELLYVAHAAVAPDKYQSGDPSPLWLPPSMWANPAGMLPYRVGQLEGLLTRAYPGDSHFVTYVVVDPEGQVVSRQPRVNKDQLANLRAHGFEVFHNFFCVDVDLPNHREITLDDVLDAQARLPMHLLWYTTRAGIRVCQPLDHPVSPETYEARLPAFLSEIQTLLGPGWIADAACVDWGRHFRAPYVVRDGKPTGIVHGRIPQGEDMKWYAVRDFHPRRVQPQTPTLQVQLDERIKGQVVSYVRAYPPAISGEGGHDRTLKLACDLSRGFSLPDHVVLNILRRWNARCVPPWSDKDLRSFLMGSKKRLDIAPGYLIEADVSDPTLIEEV